jgi:hypothetical protein
MRGAAGVAARFKGLPKRQKADIHAATATAAEPAKANAIDRWIAADLEVHDGAVSFAKVLRQTPGWPANKTGTTENAIWQRLRNLPSVKHDPNNGRPRYFGICVRAKPKLATVDGTRVVGQSQK